MTDSTRIIASFEEHDGCTMTIIHDGTHYHGERTSPDGTITRPQPNLGPEEAIGYLAHQLQGVHYLLRKNEVPEAKGKFVPYLKLMVDSVLDAIENDTFPTKNKIRMVEAGVKIGALDLEIAEHQHLGVAYILTANQDADCPDLLKRQLEATCTSPLAKRNRITRKSYPGTDILPLLEADLARTERIETMSPEEARDGLQEMVELARQRHPKLGLRFGFIGNTAMFGAPGNNSDRSWYIFTNAASANVHEYKFGGQGSDKLPALLVDAEERLDDWLVHLDSEMAAGRCHLKP